MGDETDAVQNVRIDKLEATDEKHTERIGAIEGAQGILSSRFDGVEKNIDEIKLTMGTSAVDMREGIDALRKDNADREDRRADRETKATTLWWKQFWGFAASIVPILGALAGGGYYAMQDTPAATVAPVEAPAP